MTFHIDDPGGETMGRLINWLFNRKSRRAEGDYPASMHNDSCWSGSGKAYLVCHRPEDRQREKELGLDRKGKSLCDAFA
jgi:hypothetical protein